MGRYIVSDCFGASFDCYPDRWTEYKDLLVQVCDGQGKSVVW